MRDQGLDVVLHHGSQGFIGPGTVDHPVAKLRIPDKIVAAQILAMVFGDVDSDLATSEIEDALLRLGGKEFHIVGRSDLAEDMGVIQNLLVQDVGILACALVRNVRHRLYLTIGSRNLTGWSVALPNHSFPAACARSLRYGGAKGSK